MARAHGGKGGAPGIPGALQLPLTVASRFTVQAAGGGLERIVLAAMQVPGGDDALALVWAPSPSNWFGTVWSLQLQSPGGIMQGGVPVSLVELATVNPAAGHTYEALVSVDEEGRGLALAVVDRTEGKSLWRGTVELAGLPGELVPAMGVRGSFEEQAQVRPTPEPMPRLKPGPRRGRKAHPSPLTASPWRRRGFP